MFDCSHSVIAFSSAVDRQLHQEFAGPQLQRAVEDAGRLLAGPKRSRSRSYRHGPPDPLRQEIAKLPQMKCIRMGTRDMARWDDDFRQLKRSSPDVTIVSCHDEYLPATLLEGADGALAGFAGFVPELIVKLVTCALAGDLAGA